MRYAGLEVQVAVAGEGHSRSAVGDWTRTEYTQPPAPRAASIDW